MNIMKHPIAILVIIALLFMTSCVVRRSAGRSGKVPPGQAKKMYGTQSARQFAPGHRK